MSPSVLIISEPNTHSTKVVRRRLEAMGIATAVIDPGRYPSELRVEIASRGKGARTVRFWGSQDEVLVLDNVRSIWLNHNGRQCSFAPKTDPRAAKSAVETSDYLLRAIWDSEDATVFPGRPSLISRAQNKLLQLRMAERYGLAVPSTICSNDPDAFLSFYEANEGQVISKLLTYAGALVEGREDIARFTQFVLPSDLVHVQGIRLCPMLFQGYVEKHSELRVIVVGGQVFACELDSQSSNRARVDWRQYDNVVSYRPTTIPVHIEKACVKLVEDLGLLYGALDFVLRPDGEYVFLEVNASGQYEWIEDASGLEISNAIADLLAGVNEVSTKRVGGIA